MGIAEPEEASVQSTAWGWGRGRDVQDTNREVEEMQVHGGS